MPNQIIAIDTNILLDYFLERDNFAKAHNLISATATGDVVLYIPLLVILEFDWILKGFYKIDKPTIIHRIGLILEMPNCEVKDRQLLTMALELYKKESGVSLDDCLIILEAIDNKCADFSSSDSKLIKLYAKLKTIK